jgi:hypothetical protein
MVTRAMPVTPDVSKEIQKYGEKAVGQIGSYEALLENSIGKLVKVQVQDVDGTTRYYNGILREYSSNYIVVYNVDFPIDEEAIFEGERLLKEFPRERLDFHGWQLNEPPHLQILNYKIKDNRITFDIKNIHSDYINVEKIKIGDKEITLKDPIFLPGEMEHIEVEGEFSQEPKIHILYKIIKVADVIWPASKAKVVGSGEPTESIIESILKIFTIKG